jgi:Na+/proline symporter
VLLSLFALTFNYFSNLHTLTRLMHVDLADPAQKELRIASITDLLLAQLTEGIK